MTRSILTVCVSVSFALGFVSAQAAEKKGVDLSKLPPASDKTSVTYATDIKPILEKSCITCHGADKHKGRLRLDGLEAVLKGGEDGKVVVPGNSAESMLVHNIAQAGDPDAYMPPPKNKANIPPLTKEQIGIIRAWIDQGAK
jgi:mono/diheme cytochrome c family protein